MAPPVDLYSNALLWQRNVHEATAARQPHLVLRHPAGDAGTAK